MSFFNLFRSKVSLPPETLPEPPRAEAPVNTQPISPGGDRKSIRLSQRELLYGAVRDVMIRAGVLVASYRFKVLSLDAQGRQYLIMMDLLKVDLGDMQRLEEIETMIVQTAKVRHDLLVTGVYWRNELQKVNVGVTQTPRTASTPAPPSLRNINNAPAPKPLYPEENERLQTSVSRVAAEKLSKAGIVISSKNKQSLAPDFEDTRAVDPAEYGSQLSTTQYGDLQ